MILGDNTAPIDGILMLILFVLTSPEIISKTYMPSSHIYMSVFPLSQNFEKMQIDLCWVSGNVVQVENKRICETKEPTCIHLFCRCVVARLFIFLWLSTKTMIYMLILNVLTCSMFCFVLFFFCGGGVEYITTQ